MELFKRGKNKTAPKITIGSLVKFWNKSYAIFFVILFVALAGYGAFIWYDSLYAGTWSADKKQQYLNSQEKSISLKEREFNSALEEIGRRKAEYEKEYQPIKDIFVPYEGANVQK